MNAKSNWLARALLVAGLAVAAVPEIHAQQQTPCHWWELFRKCDQPVEGLPAEAPRTGTVVTIDVATNTVYLFRDGKLVRKSAAATGSGKTMQIGDDVWEFYTPRGHMKVLSKIKDPVWRKPDWIHGTDDADSIGRYASHGCVRLPHDMLEMLWKNVAVGTDVYVFESKPMKSVATD